MPVKLRLLLILLSLTRVLCAGIVINEVCYDPPGADSGKEWIELFNASDQSLDLTGCRIYSGGSSYSLDFTFPYFVLRPGRYLLIGGSQVPNRHFTHNFSFQNGGSASDAIRFVSADSSYTDTVVYDSPNSNQLIDDSGLPALSLAPDAPEGSSLARIANGHDTDLCADDFRIETNPTPGLPNRVRVDYALLDPELEPRDGGIMLSLKVANLSDFAPHQHALFRLHQDAQLIHEEEIAPLEPGEMRKLEIWLLEDYPVLMAEISLEDDPFPENNTLYISSLGLDAAPPVFSEIYPVPQTGEQEWIELFSAAESKDEQEYLITDEAGNRIQFSLPSVPGYYVLCTDKESLMAAYPNCPAAAIIESSSWAALNNSGDSLLLTNADESEVLDAFTYNAAQAVSGMALQRISQPEGADIWRLGLPNPGQDNQINDLPAPDHPERLKLIGSPCDPRNLEEILISHNLPDPSIRVNCSIYDLWGRKIRQVAGNRLLSGQGALSWDGKTDGGSFARRGLYIILWESQAENGAKVFRRQLSAVIK